MRVVEARALEQGSSLVALARAAAFGKDATWAEAEAEGVAAEEAAAAEYAAGARELRDAGVEFEEVQDLLPHAHSLACPAPVARHFVALRGEDAVGAAAVTPGATLDGEALVGSVGGRGRRAHVHGVATVPAARRQGVAQKLLREAALWCKGWGAEALYAHTTADNESALGAYAKAGFVVEQEADDGAVLLRLDIASEGG